MMKKWIGVLVAAALCCFVNALSLPTVVQDPSRCLLDLELHFFNEKDVIQGMAFYNVREESWSLVMQMLRNKSIEVPERMKRKTAYMVPNPIEYPMQRGIAARILKEVLFEVFLETMRANYLHERPTVDLIFDYIFTQQLPRFVACFGDEARKLEPKFE